MGLGLWHNDQGTWTVDHGVRIGMISTQTVYRSSDGTVIWSCLLVTIGDIGWTVVFCALTVVHQPWFNIFVCVIPCPVQVGSI